MPLARQLLVILLFGLSMLVAVVSSRSMRPVRHDEVVYRQVTYRIPVNQAETDTLCLLPGVGPGIARRVISHRETTGPFESADDLEDVSGIGAKKRASIEPWVVFD